MSATNNTTYIYIYMNVFIYRKRWIELNSWIVEDKTSQGETTCNIYLWHTIKREKYHRVNWCLHVYICHDECTIIFFLPSATEENNMFVYMWKEILIVNNEEKKCAHQVILISFFFLLLCFPFGLTFISSYNTYLYSIRFKIDAVTNPNRNAPKRKQKKSWNKKMRKKNYEIHVKKTSST